MGIDGGMNSTEFVLGLSDSIFFFVTIHLKYHVLHAVYRILFLSGPNVLGTGHSIMFR